MKHKKRKALALGLAAAQLVPVSGYTAFAAEPTELPASGALEDGITYTVSQTTTLIGGLTVAAGATVTIVVPEGVTLTMPTTGAGITNNGGTLTIKGAGTVRQNGNNYVVNNAEGTLNVEGTVTISGSSSGTSIVRVGSDNKAATFNLSGGRIESLGGAAAVKVEDYYSTVGGNKVWCKFSMTGGSVVSYTLGEVKTDFELPGLNGLETGVDNPDKQEVVLHNAVLNYGITEIAGGEVLGVVWSDGYNGCYRCGETTISGGKVVGSLAVFSSGAALPTSTGNDAPKVTVSGGTFTGGVTTVATSSPDNPNGTIALDGGEIKLTQFEDKPDAGSSMNITIGAGASVSLEGDLAADEPSLRLPAGKCWAEDTNNPGKYIIDDAEAISAVEMTDPETTEFASGDPLPGDSDIMADGDAADYCEVAYDGETPCIAWTKDGSAVTEFSDAGDYTAKVTLTAYNGYYFDANTAVPTGWTKGDITADGSQMTISKTYEFTKVLGYGTVEKIESSVTSAADVVESGETNGRSFIITFDAAKPITGGLKYSDADTNIGRNFDGYWVGLMVTPPEGADVSQAKIRSVTVFGENGLDENGDPQYGAERAYKPDNAADGTGKCGLWGGLYNEMIKALLQDGAAKADTVDTMELAYYWQIAWDGDFTSDRVQTAAIIFDGKPDENGNTFFQTELSEADHEHNFSWDQRPSVEPSDLHVHSCSVCGYYEDAVESIAFTGPEFTDDGMGSAVTIEANAGFELDTDGVKWTEGEGTAEVTGAPEAGKTYTAHVTLKTLPKNCFKLNDNGDAYSMTLPEGWEIESTTADEYSITLRKSGFAAEAAPAAEIDYVNEKLTGLDADGEYIINDAADPVTADADGAVDIDEAWFDTEISIKKNGGTKEQKLTLAARPAAPSVETVKESSEDAADGKITGVTTDMEYKADGAGEWTSCEGTEITGLTAGTYRVRVKAAAAAPAGKAADVEITVADKIDIADAVITIADADKQVYDGTAKTPAVTVKVGGDTLTADADYTAAYSDNTDAGEATVTITGKGRYTGKATDNFTIAKAEQSAPAKPEIASKTDSSVTLRPIADNSVSKAKAEYSIDGATWQDSTEFTKLDSGKVYEFVARYKATNNYNASKASGVTEVTTEEISEDPISITTGAAITLTAADKLVYDGKAKTPAVESVVLADGTELAADDYDVAYSGNINAGEATVTITGKGKYTGAATVTFIIAKAEQSAPAAPTYTAKSKYSVTLKPIEDSAVSGAKAEYSIDGGKTWQDSFEFTGLKSGTSYKFVARYKAASNYNASAPSQETAVSTSSSGGGGSIGGGSSYRPSRTDKTDTPSSLPKVIGGEAKGWIDISAEINSKPNASTVTIEMNGDATVPAAVLVNAANKDIRLILRVDNTFTWELDGANISGTVGAVSFAVSDAHIGSSELSAPALAVCDETKAFSVSDVPFKFKPVLKANLGAKHAGKFANLYRKNALSGALEFVGVTKADSAGCADIPVGENGTFVIAVDDETKLMGDIDNSMGVNALDAAALLKEIVTKLNTGAYKSDFNGDGIVNALDASEILKWIVGLE